MKKLLPLLLILAACVEEDHGPVAVALGEDGCSVCRMIISEAPYAAQARLGPGEVEKYDDIGCLVERLAKGAAPREMWVTDFVSGRWIEARSATYVHAPDHYTPMASGIVAFTHRSDAEAWAAKEKGRLLTFEDVTSIRRPR